MTRRVTSTLLALGVVAVALVALVLVHRPASPLPTRVDEVARTLRCPTCEGQSVAASETPIARSMRAEIRHQLQAGRSPDQVRAWFVARYGADIVTTPSKHGPALLLWILPVAALALGLGLAVWHARRTAGPGGRPARSGPARTLGARRTLVALAVCAAAGAAVPAAVALGSSGPSTASTADLSPADSASLGPAAWVRLGRTLDRQGDIRGAEHAYRRALALEPGKASARTRLAFDLLRGQHLRPAEHLTRPVASHPGRYRPLALLVLGLAQRGQGEAEADATLRTFLRVAPHHAAAGQVRRLLGDD